MTTDRKIDASLRLAKSFIEDALKEKPSNKRTAQIELALDFLKKAESLERKFYPATWQQKD